MKIQNITSYNYQNNIQKSNIQKYSTKSKSDVTEIKSNLVSFSGIKEFGLKLQAKKLELDAWKIHKEAALARKTSYLIQDKAIDILRDGQQIEFQAQFLLNEVLDIIVSMRSTDFEDEYDRDNNSLIRRFYEYDEYNEKCPPTIEEYDNDGNVIRKIEFDMQTIKVVEYDSVSGHYDAYTFDTDSGKLIKFALDVDLDDDDTKASERYLYNQGNVVSYDTDYRLNRKGVEKFDERYEFSNLQLSDYYTNLRIETNGIKESDERYFFNEGVLYKVKLGEVDLFEKRIGSIEEYEYDEDGGIISATVGLEQEYGTLNAEAEKIFKFSELGLEKIYLDVEFDAKKRKTSAKQMFYCQNEEAKRCAYDYECTNYEKEDFSKIVRVK